MTIKYYSSFFNKFSANYFILLVFVAIISSCKKPYDPPAVKSANSYLVVEGVINSGGDSTIITLSRTVKIDTVGHVAVTGAVLTVQDDQNGSQMLREKTPGVYVSPALTINKARKYRLNIETSDNKQYASDYMAVLTTPPIDSIGFTVKNVGTLGLQVYVNTHDATNTIQYYRWDYSEEWQFHSFFNSTAIDSQFVKPNGKILDSVVTRYQNKQIYTCFAGDTSSDIVLGSTAGLKQAVLNQAPIAFIPSTSEKIEARYSILIKQYALTADAYNFYNNIRKNTEQLGSIFDALPSEISGNIHCISNPSEPVIGYMVVNNVTSKRVFISNTVLPQTWVATYPSFCILSPKPMIKPPPTLEQSYFLTPGVFEFIDLAEDLSTPICVDCTIRGKRSPPSYWVFN